MVHSAYGISAGRAALAIEGYAQVGEWDIYARVSTKAQEDDGTSLDTQEAGAVQYCAERGYRVRRVWRETFTGTELNRPLLSELRRDIRAGRVEGVVVYAHDRLSRNQTHLVILLHEAREADVRIEAVTERLDDTPTGRFIQSALGFVAEVEHEKILERTLRGLRERAESGKLQAGAVPLYGYRWRRGEGGRADAYELDEETAPIVREIFRRAARGETNKAICRWLTESGVPTPSQVLAARGELGNRRLTDVWRRGNIARMLTNPAYMGAHVQWKRRVEKRKRRDEVTGEVRTVKYQARREDGAVMVGDATCPAIVDEATWRAANLHAERNRDEAARHNREPEATLLRAGYVYCGHCERRAIAAYHKPRALWTYRCKYSRATSDGAGEVCPVNGFTMQAAALDAEVWDAIAGVLRNPSLLEQAWRRRQEQRREQREDTDATLASVDALLRKAEARKDAARRALNAAIANGADEETMGLCTQNMTAANADIKRLITQRDKLASLNDARDLADAQMQFMVEHAALAAEHLPYYGYADKRRWLQLLGARVYVYREGYPQPPHGARWRMVFEWDGLNALVGATTHTQGECPNTQCPSGHEARAIVPPTPQRWSHNVRPWPPLDWAAIAAELHAACQQS